MGEVEKALADYKHRRRGRPRSGKGLVHPEVRSIYVPNEIQFVWSRFQEIVKREGKSVSEAVVEYVCDYVIKHDPGNPQARMTSFGEGGSIDIASIEGRIRTLFFNRGNVQWLDIVQTCKERNLDTKIALAMAGRVQDWLIEKKIRVWR